MQKFEIRNWGFFQVPSFQFHYIHSRWVFLFFIRSGTFYKIILSILLFSATESQAQSVITRFLKLSCPEKRWVICHPFISKKILLISDTAVSETKMLVSDTTLDGDLNGGQLDAFRHSFWMAKITQHFGARKALSLGKAHEKGNYRYFKKHRTEDGTVPDFESCQMDLQNNETGIEIGKNNPQLSSADIVSLIISKIRDGKLVIIKKDKQGRYLTCDEHVLNHITNTWKTGKCLTPSNYGRKIIHE
jgi:hypothetical protein